MFCIHIHQASIDPWVFARHLGHDDVLSRVEVGIEALHVDRFLREVHLAELQDGNETIAKPWENHSKTHGKTWENHRKIMGKPGKTINHSKTMGKP